ncbi:MAG: hypothetical protein A6F71_10390 [Cycloclasticus sp. symbiont of Poecilosclerida sp. M]|nr:MAG: hypothetical protein A6F71_10390 [Cycloclasticus sp. symbiont of Poecilosclerida sp. M]
MMQRFGNPWLDILFHIVDLTHKKSKPGIKLHVSTEKRPAKNRMLWWLIRATSFHQTSMTVYMKRGHFAQTKIFQ